MRTENMEDWTADTASCYLTEGHQVAGEGGSHSKKVKAEK